MKKHLSYRTSFFMASLVTSMLPSPIILTYTLNIKYVYVLTYSQPEYVSPTVLKKINLLTGSFLETTERYISLVAIFHHALCYLTERYISLVVIFHHALCYLKVTAKARSDPTHLTIKPLLFCRGFTFLVEVEDIPLDQDMH